MKRDLVLMLGAVGVVGAIGVTPAVAQFGEGGFSFLHEYYYYSDSGYTNLDGQGYEDCDGLNTSGTVTQYKLVREIGECQNGVEWYY